jgi:hypothetical protein
MVDEHGERVHRVQGVRSAEARHGPWAASGQAGRGVRFVVSWRVQCERVRVGEGG